MSRPYVRGPYLREDLVASLLAAADKLGRTPTLSEFQLISGINLWKLRRGFGNYRAALRAAGLDSSLLPDRISSAAMLQDWGRVTRKLGHIPTRAEYKKLGRYSPCVVHKRFQGWVRMHEHFLEYLKSEGLSHRWTDVAQIALRSIGHGRGRRPKKLPAAADAAGSTPLPPPVKGMQRVTLAVFALFFSRSPSRGPRRVFEDRPLMGPPLALPGLAHEPLNEMGVVFLFGMIAHQLGFLVESMRIAFPDCEAKREVEPGLWQRVAH